MILLDHSHARVKKDISATVYKTVLSVQVKKTSFNIRFYLILTNLDIDECDPVDPKHDCHANAECINIAGSFQCNCLDGYIGSGVECSGDKHVHNTSFSKIFKIDN